MWTNKSKHRKYKGETNSGPRKYPMQLFLVGQNCDREVRLPGTVAPFPPVLLDLLLSQAMEFSETAWFFVVFLETKGYHGKSMYYILYWQVV